MAQIPDPTATGAASSTTDLAPATNGTSNITSVSLAALGAARSGGTSTSALLETPFPFFAPSFNLAFIGTLLALVLTVVHIRLLWKTKAWYFNIMSQAALLLGIGLGLKLAVILNNSMSSLLQLSAPLLIAPGEIIPIQLVMTYTRLIWWAVPIDHRNKSHLWIPPRATSIIILGGQNIGTLLGLLGSGSIIRPPPPRLAAVGADVEMLVWMFFTLLAARLTYFIGTRRWDVYPAEKRKEAVDLGIALTVSGVLISIRGVMQVMEKDAIAGLTTPPSSQSTQAAPPTPSPVIAVEWLSYAFDYFPLLAVLVIMAQVYPGHYFPRNLVGLRLRTKVIMKKERVMDFQETMAESNRSGATSREEAGRGGWYEGRNPRSEEPKVQSKAGAAEVGTAL